MAQKKVEVVAEFRDIDGTALDVWCEATLEDFSAIEGITFAKQHGPSKWMVWLDPRYNGREVRQEIIAKFSAPIPDVFKEALDEGDE